MLIEEFSWRGRTVRWGRAGSGPAVVFCHGTPWSSELWRPIAEALAPSFTVYLWDMPGYGRSSKDPEHRVSLDVQGELFADLLSHWELASPHVVAHDFGGAVSLRALLLHRSSYASLALVDVVALPALGVGLLPARGREPAGLRPAPGRRPRGGRSGRTSRGPATVAWRPPTWTRWSPRGWAMKDRRPFYRQIEQADEAYTDEIESRYADIDLPTLVAWGQDDTWIPVDRAHRLHELIPGSRLRLIANAGHLIQLDQPEALTAVLTTWLSDPT